MSQKISYAVSNNIFCNALKTQINTNDNIYRCNHHKIWSSLECMKHEKEHHNETYPRDDKLSILSMLRSNTSNPQPISYVNANTQTDTQASTQTNIQTPQQTNVQTPRQTNVQTLQQTNTQPSIIKNTPPEAQETVTRVDTRPNTRVGSRVGALPKVNIDENSDIVQKVTSIITDKKIVLQYLTTKQRNDIIHPENGLIILNSDTMTIDYYVNKLWISVMTIDKYHRETIKLHSKYNTLRENIEMLSNVICDQTTSNIKIYKTENFPPYEFELNQIVGIQDDKWILANARDNNAIGFISHQTELYYVVSCSGVLVNLRTFDGNRLLKGMTYYISTLKNGYITQYKPYENSMPICIAGSDTEAFFQVIAQNTSCDDIDESMSINNNNITDILGSSVVLCALYKLNFSYTGSCLRIGTVDGAINDIGFDQNGIVDIMQIQQFAQKCTNTDKTCYVICWYDQSDKKNDMTVYRDNSRNQPLFPNNYPAITNSIGIVLTNNGLPVLFFDNNNKMSSRSIGAQLTMQSAVYTVLTNTQLTPIPIKTLSDKNVCVFSVMGFDQPITLNPTMSDKGFEVFKYSIDTQEQLGTHSRLLDKWYTSTQNSSTHNAQHMEYIKCYTINSITGNVNVMNPVNNIKINMWDDHHIPQLGYIDLFLSASIDNISEAGTGLCSMFCVLRNKEMSYKEYHAFIQVLYKKKYFWLNNDIHTLSKTFIHANPHRTVLNINKLNTLVSNIDFSVIKLLIPSNDSSSDYGEILLFDPCTDSSNNVTHGLHVYGFIDPKNTFKLKSDNTNVDDLYYKTMYGFQCGSVPLYLINPISRIIIPAGKLTNEFSIITVMYRHNYNGINGSHIAIHSFSTYPMVSDTADVSGATIYFKGESPHITLQVINASNTQNSTYVNTDSNEVNNGKLNRDFASSSYGIANCGKLHIACITLKDSTVSFGFNANIGPGFPSQDFISYVNNDGMFKKTNTYYPFYFASVNKAYPPNCECLMSMIINGTAINASQFVSICNAVKLAYSNNFQFDF